MPINKYTAGFGERLKLLRRSAVWDQQELAVRLQVTRQSISGYETERLFPSRMVIDRICDLFRINPWWLLFGVGSASIESRKATGKRDKFHSFKDKRLTNTQQVLIEYIRSDPKVAANLVKLLWDISLKC